IAQYCSKGSLIGLTGRIQVRSYEKDGKRRYVTEVVAESVALLESRNSQHGQGQGNNFQNGNNSPFDDPNPFDLPDDGLPF
ncbi:single-stranded DNA-binding protein, partial [Streptococcus pneumoniae]|nr:single-stranded DNA-binding protein [Streptococcus pneumoniae]